MSKHTNVHPGQYKVGGSLRPNEDDRTEQAKAKASIAEHELREEARDNAKKKED